MFGMHAQFNLHALPGVGVFRRKHARAFFAGLRKIVCQDRNSIRELKGEKSVAAITPPSQIGPDSKWRDPRILKTLSDKTGGSVTFLDQPGDSVQTAAHFTDGQCLLLFKPPALKPNKSYA